MNKTWYEYGIVTLFLVELALVLIYVIKKVSMAMTTIIQKITQLQDALIRVPDGLLDHQPADALEERSVPTNSVLQLLILLDYLQKCTTEADDR